MTKMERGAHTDWWPQNFARVHELRQSGMPWKVIAYKCGYPYVSNIATPYLEYAKRHNIPLPPVHRWTRKKYDAIKADRESGMLWAEIGPKHNLHPSGIASSFGLYARMHNLPPVHVPYNRKNANRKPVVIAPWRITRYANIMIARGYCTWAEIAERFGFTSSRAARQWVAYYQKRM